MTKFERDSLYLGYAGGCLLAVATMAIGVDLTAICIGMPIGILVAYLMGMPRNT